MTRARVSRSGASARRRAARRGDTAASRAAAVHGAAPMAALPKLDVSTPDEPSEREADAVADRVMEGRDVAGIGPDEGVARALEESEASDAPEVVERQAADDAPPVEEPPVEEPVAAARAVHDQEEEPVARAAEEQAEEEPVARAVEEQAEEEPVARAVEEQSEARDAPEAVRRQALPEGPPAVEEEDPSRTQRQVDARVQRKADGSAAAASAIAHPGPGRPLPATTRSAIEPHLGRSLAGVRVHDDAAAREAAHGIRARAFTNRENIWLGPGASPYDVRLMAHEAAHVLQQSGGPVPAGPVPAGPVPAGPVPAARVPESTAPPEAPSADRVETQEGMVDLSASPRRLDIKKMSVPDFKLQDTQRRLPLRIRSGTRAEDEPQQRAHWEGDVGAAADAAFDEKVSGKPTMRDEQRNDTGAYFLQSDDRDVLLIGTPGTLKPRARRPVWDRRGRYRTHDVDHIHEHQLGGEDAISNLWLLDSSANRSSGVRISNELDRRIARVLASARPTLGDRLPDAETVRREWDVRVRTIDGRLRVTGDPRYRYSPTDVKSGLPLRQLKVLTADQVRRQGLQGSAETFVLYLAALGGPRRTVPIGEDGQPDPSRQISIGRRGAVTLSSLAYDRASGTGSVVAHVWRQNALVTTTQPLALEIGQIPGVGWGGALKTWGLEKKIEASLKGASPIAWHTAAIDPEVGVVARGQVLPTIPLIRDAGIDVVVEGNDVYLEKVFSAGEISLPPPMTITQASLALQGGTAGLRAEGDIGFEVAHLGTGALRGDVSLGSDGLDFGLAGTFAFDTELFEKAEISATYGRSEAGDYELGGGGVLEIGRGKVRGIRGARIEAQIHGERITAKGDVDVDAPGVQSGELELVSDPEAGLQIAGELQLSDDIPGIAGGTLTARVAEREDGGYALSGSIAATTDIPGISGAVAGTYDDGAFTAAATLGYARGRLSGQVRVGATNRALVDGEPAGEATDEIVAFGRGSLTLRLTDWLEGTADVEIGPTGSLTVVGEIGVPSTLDLFPQKKLERTIFSVNLDIPIVGLSVAGQNVGIFASIGGGLDALAAVGPGQLRDTSVQVTYSPDDESKTAVHGSAEFYVPASAGLRVNVRGALGAGIPLVDARAGLELGGALGIEGFARVGVSVDWMPSTGLDLRGEAQIRAEPTFTFDVTGFVDVTFDYFIGTKTLYERRWQLAAFRYGSGLALGVRVPVRWREGEPFDLSYDDIELTYPDISADRLLRGLVRQIA